MGNVNYNEWLNGKRCCGQNNIISIARNCHHNHACDCDNILLEISKLYTNDEILQDEIDNLSGDVENKLDASAYTPVDLTDYYTKEQVDELIPIVPSLSGYATEQWVLDKNYITGVDLSNYALKSDIPTSNSAFTNDMGYLTEHQPLKTINGQVISGTGNIEITASGGTINVDNSLSSASTNPVANSAITEAINTKLDASAYTQSDWNQTNSGATDYIKNKPTIPSLDGYATEDWVRSQGYLTEHQPLSGYVTNATFLQYVTNLQQQINSLIAEVSGCCGSSGETQYRWVTMTGENDYWCSGTTKMSKEKEQSSTDGIIWSDTGVERNGSTVLEENCVECGYVPALTGKKYTGVTTANTEGSYDCNCDEDYDSPVCRELNPHELVVVFNPRGVGKMKSVTVGECVNVIGAECFTGETNLQTLILPPTITAINSVLLGGCTSIQNLTLLGTTPPIFHAPLGVGDTGLFYYNEAPPANFRIYVPSESVDAYKAANGWSDYANRIQAI